MLFHSLEFALFLPLVLAVYALAGLRSHGLQNAWIVAASYVFYGWWDARFLFLIATSTVVDYTVALSISGVGPTRAQRLRASAALVLAALVFGSLGLRWGPDGAVLSAPVGEGTWSIAPLVASLAWAVLAELLFPWLSRAPAEQRRRIALGLSLSVNLGLLGFFKYYDFFAESFAIAMRESFGLSVNPLTLGLVLPVGISFYTLQTISYAIDVYRGEVHATRSLRDFAAYVAFFPQLVAGPIERGRSLLPQFERPRAVGFADLRAGAWLVLWGLFKKVAVADAAGDLVDLCFGPYDDLTRTTAPEDGVRVWIALYAFALQIYADFSGYSDIARAARA